MDPLPNPAPLASKLRNTLVRYHSIADSEWRVAKKTKDATVWRKQSEEFSGYLYKAQGVVEDVTNRIVDHIRPGPYRLDWDSLMTSMDILETFEENCCVMRYTTAGQLWNIIAPREFVDFSYTTSYEDGLLTCGISLDYGEILLRHQSSGYAGRDEEHSKFWDSLERILRMHQQYRWMDRSRKGRREEKMQSKDFVRAVYILSSPICADKIFNQLHTFYLFGFSH
ncbi:stAR-related lipid transfer protein 4 isoform X2 [Parus major]|nr:stAR-related lipid transfer protein 4 isoform X2 [Parus major]